MEKAARDGALRRKRGVASRDAETLRLARTAHSSLIGMTKYFLSKMLTCFVHLSRADRLLCLVSLLLCLDVECCSREKNDAARQATLRVIR